MATRFNQSTVLLGIGLLAMFGVAVFRDKPGECRSFPLQHGEP